MITTGIFGGTFNPIHNGHIALARTLLREAHLDEVWFVVSPQNPWKQNQELLDDHLRLEMVRAALESEAQSDDGEVQTQGGAAPQARQQEGRMVASDCEFHLPRPSYMWHTLQHLSANHPEREFVLLIGGDNWEGFDRWYHYEDILKNHRLVVYPRANEKTAEKQEKAEGCRDSERENAGENPGPYQSENKCVTNAPQRTFHWTATDVPLVGNGLSVETQRSLPCETKGISIVDTPLLDISSTDIRRRIASGQPWEHLVPPAAAEIIKKNHYYYPKESFL